MFDNEIWEIVPKRETEKYFAPLLKTKPNVKRKRTMSIWSFKRKRHPDGSLSKYKARLCCHRGQQQFLPSSEGEIKWLVILVKLVRECWDSPLQLIK